jgi:hypothetical protein
MIQRPFFTVTILLAAVSVGTAGTIVNEVWSPSGCGAEPVAPIIEQDSIDAYNKSIKAINDWQQKIQAFNECMIKEANADNALIAKTANDQQSRMRAVIDKIKSDMDAAKAKLENK